MTRSHHLPILQTRSTARHQVLRPPLVARIVQQERQDLVSRPRQCGQDDAAAHVARRQADLARADTVPAERGVADWQYSLPHARCVG